MIKELVFMTLVLTLVGTIQEGLCATGLIYIAFHLHSLLLR